MSDDERLSAELDGLERDIAEIRQAHERIERTGPRGIEHRAPDRARRKPARRFSGILRGAAAVLGALGASGARLATTAINRLHTTRGRYALCTMCIGVGQGIAVILERI